MTDISKMDPASPVQMTDRSGNIVQMNAGDAQKELSDPRSDYVLTTNDQVDQSNNDKLYGTPGQKALTAVEQGVNTATLGLAAPIAKQAVNTLYGDQASKEFEDSFNKRSQTNPVSSAVGTVGGIASDPFGAFSAIGKLGEGVAKVTTPIIENTLGKGVISKATDSLTKYATEGGIFGLSNEFGKQSFDDLPYNGEAMLNATGKSALDMAVLGTAVHHGLEASNFLLGKVSSGAKSYLDKVTGASGDQAGEAISQVDRDAVKRNSADAEDNPGLKDGVKLEKQPDGTLVNKSDRGNIQVNSVSGNGLDLSTPDGLRSAGSDLGIRDLDTKYKYLKEPVETPDEFMTSMKKNQLANSWVSENYDGLSDGEKRQFDNAESIKDKFKTIENPTDAEVGLYRQAVDESERIASVHSRVTSTGEVETMEPPDLKKSQDASLKKVQDYFNGLDYIDDGKNIHVYNTDILPETMTRVKNFEGTEGLSGEAQGVRKQFDVTGKKLARMGNDQFNEVASTILDHYPNQMTKIGDVGTSFDYIAKGVKNSLNKAGEDLAGVVEKSYNQANDLDVKTSVTTESLARYIEDKVLPQYIDKMTGNALAGQTEIASALKKTANEFRENGFKVDKYGQRVYEPIDVKTLWQERQRLDKMSKWSSTTDTAITNMYKNLRFHVDDEIINSMKAVDPKLASDYVDAKANWRKLNAANEIVGKAAEKSLGKSSVSIKGGMIGGLIGGAPGAIIGGAANKWLDNNSGNLQAYFARSMNDGMSKYLDKVDSATSSFFRNTEGTIKPMLRYSVLAGADTIKRDNTRLQAELNNRADFTDKFIDLNKGMFSIAPNTGNGMLMTAFRARDFLLQKIPKNPYAGIPYRENQWTPNPQDISRYLRYREAVEKPSVIINQIKDGYVTPQAVEVLNQVYPQTKELLKQKMIDKISGEKQISQDKRMILFKVFDIPLDSYSSGPLFAQMQSNAQGMINQEMAANNPDNAPINTSKLSNPMQNLTLGNNSLSMQD